MNIPLLCADAHPTFLGLFDLTIAPPLLFYSYIPIVLVSLAFGMFILVKDRYSLQSKLIFLIALSFSLWVINILVQWIAVHVTVVHYSWQLTAIFEILIFFFSIYFIEVFITKKDVQNIFKIILSLPVLIVAVLLPTKFNVFAFDYQNCQSIVGILWTWIYSFEICTVLYIVISALYRTRNLRQDLSESRQIVHVVSGVALFLLVFSLSNILGELTKTYQINLIGPIGMLLFLAFLSYTITKYKTFNIKILGVQIFVIAICSIVVSLLFIENLSIIHTLIYITTLFLVILGVLLVKGVKKEVSQREEIQKLAEDLKKSNTRLLELDKQKSEFVSYATHQLRAPLTAMKGYTSMLLDGDLGTLPKNALDAVSRIFESSKTLANVVDDYLNVSRIELGTMKYLLEPIDLKEMLNSVIAELKPSIEKSSAKFSVSYLSCDVQSDGSNHERVSVSGPEHKGVHYIVNADRDKFKQVITNLVDNAFKYTPTGTIDVKLCRDDKKGKVVLSIKDTGIGIDPAVMPKLFSKFTRANNANSANIRGTGLGLFVAKDVVLAHKGKIWAESEGEGKGSTFYVELAAA